MASRRERAEETRRRMMEAACSLFSELGFAHTTMSAVAERAGVAVQTVYFTFHTKSELLQAAYEWAVAGPDGIPPHLMPWWQAVIDAADIQSAVTHLVDGTLPILQRAAPLVWVIRSDEEARQVYEHNEQLRRDGNTILLSSLAAKSPLRPELDPLQARDILLSLTGPQQFQLLIAEYGWPIERWRQWVAGAVLRELFALEPIPAAID